MKKQIFFFNTLQYAKVIVYRHDITEILLKEALNIITLTPCNYLNYYSHYEISYFFEELQYVHVHIILFFL